MSKKDLLLEIGLEEIPARFILDAVDQLKSKVTNWLKENKISFGEQKVYSTPRRLAILIKDVDETQQDEETEVKGPAKKIALDENNEWTKAAIGFTRSQGVSVDDIYFKEIKGVEYVHVKKFIKGKPTIELLSGLNEIITSMHFPNNMKWGTESLRFVRPIRWITAIFGTEPVLFTVRSIKSGSKTYGHRFLGETIQLTNANQYEEELKKQYVIADFEQRKAMIVEQINKLEKKHDWQVPQDEELLEEVTNLVEYPTVFYGSYDENFLTLPEEVLVTTMKAHQRYFPVKNKECKLLPYFISVRNGDDRNIDVVRKGNEKVLHARLADAVFFYEEDQKISITEAQEKLHSIIYHEQLGTIAEKVERVQKVALEITNFMKEVDKEKVSRAAEICKFDLVTNMVNEFPELQGTMGEIYALIHNEPKEIAQAIREHYLPVHAEDSVPQSTIGAIISVADKLDTIISHFSIGLIPTGSQDPYSLRRQATGIVRIFLEKDWHVSIKDLLHAAIPISAKDPDEDLYVKVEQFIKQRLHFIIEEKGIRYDINEAVLDGELINIPDTLERAKILQAQKDETNFKEIIEALARVVNIANKAEENAEISPELFENPYEQELYKQYQEVKKIFANNQPAHIRYEALASLQQVITNYFDHTMVMAENETVKKNRLAQMKKLASIIQSFASMNKIIVK